MSQSISQKFTPISLLKFALPSMVMMMFMSCYTIVDGIFISRYLGSEALSAANIVYPDFQPFTGSRNHVCDRRKCR